MKDNAQMVDQQILAYESRQKHTEELLAHAQAHTTDGPEHAEVRAQLDQLSQEHGRLSGKLDALKRRDLADWREEEIKEAGPMGVWDALAEQLEALVERLTKH